MPKMDWTRKCNAYGDYFWLGVAKGTSTPTPVEVNNFGTKDTVIMYMGRLIETWQPAYQMVLNDLQAHIDEVERKDKEYYQLQLDILMGYLEG